MNKAIFLDRDGVINECQSDRVTFVTSPKNLFLCQGIVEDIQELRQMGFKTFVVTNQGGIDWGVHSLQQVNAIHDHLQTRIEVDEIVMCPHHPRRTICDCRKPSPKMILDLAKKHRISLAKSWMVGDRDTDIQAGERAGCMTFLVKPNQGLEEFMKVLRERAPSSW
ncbi:HAD-IIIA family hydrolase [Thermoactinomyces sp. DSM 45892]|uniref:D-glycero-alpha-D-manno-heptose-1,7-bisphosphate 7-phosphatase n=1 Tax=Thermoactinomyces sp. DSM 45892 TaxID=1882753 RepID=UPI0008951672|nr:HAD family hydrolase [Thermoactinomyces sp. DSM 45892]SDY60251.1 D-glycero-D-manno-heptose 1,7-bisphosphate phosphatase [Thermoactinomyces sp. DSM 45892]